MIYYDDIYVDHHWCPECGEPVEVCDDWGLCPLSHKTQTNKAIESAAPGDNWAVRIIKQNIELIKRWFPAR